MAYTTISKVSEQLNGLSITSSTIPSIDTVNAWIEESDREIELRTGKVFSSTVHTSVLIDYDGSGRIITPEAPIISVEELLYERNGLGASSEDWVQLLEGRTKDFIVYNKEGEIVFIGSRAPSAGFKNISLSYTTGYSSVPIDVQRLSTLLTAKRIIESKVASNATSGGRDISVGTISLSAPKRFSVETYNFINNEIERLFSKVTSGAFMRRITRRFV